MRADRWPLVGRDRESAAVAEALDADPSRSVVVTGPAGVGRTRLAREGLRRAEASRRPTRWAAGTAAAGRVPLGALTHLLPAAEATTDPVLLLQRATHAVAGEAPDGALVLGVDDVHLLDPLSITVLHHLAVTGAATLVLTVRTDLAAVDPTTPLWKDDLATRVELLPLGRPDLDHLCAVVLDGDVETRTGEGLWRLSQGTPLYLRELVDHGLHTGRLRADRGLWRWNGPMTPSERLRHIVLTQIGELSVAEWTGLEVVAAAEVIPVHQVVELCGQDAVAALERRGLVAVDDAGPPARARVAHPLYAEVIRARASEAALHLVRGRFADGSVDALSPQALLRRCAAAPGDGGSAPDAEQLVEAARRATAMLDHSLAERLARAAIAAGGGVDAHLALVEAAYWQGQPSGSERLAAETTGSSVTDQQRARLAAVRALVLFCGAGRADEATRAVEDALRSVRTEAARAVLLATAAVLAFLGGNPAGAVQLSTAVLDSATSGAQARPLAAAAAASGLAVTGETERALAMARVGWEALETLPDVVEPGFVRIALAQAEILALYLSGRFPEMDLRASELYRRNLTAPAWAGDAVACLHRGWAALGSGHPRLAMRWLNEALIGFEERDPAGLQGLCRALGTMARALAGDVEGARALLRDGGGTQAGAMRVFDPHTRLAGAWVVAAEGRTKEAGALALDAAQQAAGQGQWAVEAAMLHSALSFGRAVDVVDRLRELADRLDSPLAVHFAAFAAAGVAGSADRLEAVSRAFEDRGALLPAADAAAQAAAVHDRAGDRRAAAAATARALALAREGGLVDTPAMDGLAQPDLTAREGQVARLAARGLSNLEIADRLVLSVRTVEAHLAHVYTKLGITGRPGLPEALERTPPRRPSRSVDDDVPATLRPWKHRPAG